MEILETGILLILLMLHVEAGVRFCMTLNERTCPGPLNLRELHRAVIQFPGYSTLLLFTLLALRRSSQSSVRA